MFSSSDCSTDQCKNREQELIQKHLENEAEFAQQRAKFMDMYKQKEGNMLALLSSLFLCLELRYLQFAHLLLY